MTTPMRRTADTGIPVAVGSVIRISYDAGAADNYIHGRVTADADDATTVEDDMYGTCRMAKPFVYQVLKDPPETLRIDNQGTAGT